VGSSGLSVAPGLSVAKSSVWSVVTAFRVVVYIVTLISGRGLVPGLGHPRTLALDFTEGWKARAAFC
jgi:hypothetical protein